MGFPGAPVVKKPLPVQKTQVLSLGPEDPLEKGTATHSNILARRTPWTEEPVWLQSIGSQRVGHDWVGHTHTHTSTYPEKSRGTMAFKAGSSNMCSDLQFCSSPCSTFSSIGLTLSLVPLTAPNAACQHSHSSGDGENLTSRGSFVQVRMSSQKPSAKLSLARTGSHANLQISLWLGRGRRRQGT